MRGEQRQRGALALAAAGELARHTSERRRLRHHESIQWGEVRFLSRVPYMEQGRGRVMKRREPSHEEARNAGFGALKANRPRT